MEPSADPAVILAAASDPQPGWADPWGGPIGLARATVAAQDALNHQSRELAALRAAAIQQELQTRSLSDVAHDLGITKQAVFRAAKSIHRHVDAW